MCYSEPKKNIHVTHYLCFGQLAKLPCCLSFMFWDYWFSAYIFIHMVCFPLGVNVFFFPLLWLLWLVVPDVPSPQAQQHNQQDLVCNKICIRLVLRPIIFVCLPVRLTLVLKSQELIFFYYHYYAGQMILELNHLLELFKDILLKKKKKRNLQYALSSAFKDEFTLFSSALCVMQVLS